MTPEKKAEQLAMSLWINSIKAPQAWQMARIVVNEIIASNPHSNPLNSLPVHSTMEYWLEVRKVIESNC